MKTAEINTRAYTYLNSIEEDFDLKNDKNYLFDLDFLSVLSLNGDKSLEFLQGQLTCDLRELSDIKMVQGAQCNLKGRILSLLDIIQWNGIKLILPHDLLELTQSSLAKTALLSRVKIEHVAQMKIFGFYLQNKSDLLPEVAFLPETDRGQSYDLNTCYYHLGNGFYIFVMNSDYAAKFSASFIERNQLVGSYSWHAHRLAEKQFSIYPESRGLFLPHRLDLQETDIISFDKGCYKGQEIIARTQYRATLKHDLGLYLVNTSPQIASGKKLFKLTDGNELGEIIDYAEVSADKTLIALSALKEPFDSALFVEGGEPVSITKYTLETCD